MNHHLRIFDFALKTLVRRRGKTLVVMLVYALLVGLVASLLLYVEALRREARLLLASAPELVVQRQTGGRHDLIPIARADAIRQIRGVTAVTPRVWGYSFDPPSTATLTLWGADSVPPGALEIEPGGDGQTEEIRPGHCVIGRGIADARFLWVGDRLPLKGSDGELSAPRVSGIFVSASSILTHDLVVLPSTDLRRLFGLAPEMATDLAISVHQPREVETVASKILQLWPDVRTISRSQILSTYTAIFDWRGGLWAALLLSSVAAFGILVWDKATGLSADEQHTLGLLKAVGWSPREVMELRLWEGGIVSASALLTGVLAAQIHLLAFDGALFSRLLRGWSVLFPPFDIRPELDSYTLVLCLLLTTLPYLAANLVPAWRAAVTDPDSILRG